MSWRTVPGVPERLAEALDRVGASPDARPDDWVDAAAAAVDRIADEGQREAAYALLAADALVTWACERAAQQPDAAGALERVLVRVREAM